MRAKTKTSLYFLLTLFLLNCSDHSIDNIAEKSLTYQPKTKDPLRSVQIKDDTILLKGTSYYTNQTLITEDKFQSLPLSLQDLITRKSAVRSYLLLEATSSDVFDSEEAKEYLYPRIQAILEEYYLREKLGYFSEKDELMNNLVSNQKFKNYYNANEEKLKKSGLNFEKAQQAVKAKVLKKAEENYTSRRDTYLNKLIQESKVIPSKK